jgi:hypothetical protein
MAGSLPLPPTWSQIQRDSDPFLRIAVQSIHALAKDSNGRQVKVVCVGDLDDAEE